MHKREMIRTNNEKRKELTEENKKYYEEMLLYIRLSYSKSEEETEEVLSEMLDHLLEAQREGRSAEEVFGQDPKGYADDIIGELPSMMTKERAALVITGLLALFAGIALFDGLGDLFLSLTGVLEEAEKTIHLGSFLVKALLTIPLGFLFTYIFILYLRWTTFRKVSRLLELTRDFGFGVGVFVVLFLLFFGMHLWLPPFGTEVHIPFYVSILAGGILGLLTWVSFRKS